MMGEEFLKVTRVPDIRVTMCAMAKYGGPIAIIMDKEYFILNKEKLKIERNTIYFFDPYGNLISKMNFVYTQIIVCFDFLENEYLLVVLQNGHYQLIDPFKGKFFNDKQEMLTLPINRFRSN